MEQLSVTDVLTPDAVSPEWLTQILRAGGHPEARVERFRWSAIGTGQTGKCIRLELEPAEAGEGTPATLIGKVASDDALSRSSAVAMGIYAREVLFYRELAPRLDISVPRCYYAAIDDAGEDFLILMEDLHPARPGDQLAGCTAEVARTAALELVGLQAPSWCDEDLLVRLREPEHGFFSDMHGLYNQMLPTFLKRFAAALEPEEADIIRRLGACRDAPLFQPMGRPFCLEHRDYRLDNLLIDETAAGPRVVVVDWQGLRVGRPLNDVALLIGGGLAPDLRREVEEDILRNYHAALLKAGVGDFSWEQCWHEYRRASFAGFGLTVVAAVAVQQTERGDAMFTMMARRHARHALDLGAHEFLD